MNVSVDWEPGGGEQEPRRRSRTPRPARTPRLPSQGSPGQSGPQRPGSGRGGRRTRLQLAVIGGLGFVAVIAAFIAAPGHKSGHTGGGPSPAPSHSGGASTSNDAAGLPRGTATASGLDGSRRVSGLPRGFAHTTDGAVEAASTLAANVFNLNRMSVADRTAYLTDAYVKEPAGVEAGAATWLQNQGLNSQGQYIDPTTGQPSPDTYVSNCHPELGAYRVVNSAPDAVTVDVWQPCLLGPVPNDGSNPTLQALWMVGEWNMVFKGGDWRVSSTSKGQFTTAPQPPAVAGGAVVVATSYADRARILASYGSGWELYADASSSRPAELGATQ